MPNRVLFLLSIGIVCWSTSTPALNWPFQTFGWGYDLLTGLPTAPILELTWNDGNKFTSLATGQTYDVPDQAVMADKNQETLQTTTTMIANISDFQQQEYNWHSLTIGFPGLFGFDFSKESGIVKNLLANGTKQLFIAYKQFQIFNIASWPVSVLPDQADSRFFKMVDALPTSYSTPTEKKAYLDFIQFFGTHYYPLTGYGGEITYFISLNASLVKNQTESWASKEVGLAIDLVDFQIGFDFGRNVSKGNISNSFWENVQIDCLFNPGSGNTMDCKNIHFPTWIVEVTSSPSLVKPALLNITQMFSNNQIRKNMNEAITEYLTHPPSEAWMVEAERKRNILRHTPV